MDESSEEDQSMNGGRSLSLFDWFLLPLVSLFACCQKEANHEAPIRLQSINENSNSSSDQPKLSDLPILALLRICAHLRRNDEEDNQDLYNFRNTCRTFAHAVNIFFEKYANLPTIKTLALDFNDTTIAVRAQMPPINYLLHPLKYNRIFFHPQMESDSDNSDCDPNVLISASLGVDALEAIEQAAESLCGPVNLLLVYIPIASSDINKIFKMTRNVIFKSIHISINTLTMDNGSHILAYLREHPNREVTIACDKFKIDDALEFFNQLYSSTAILCLRVCDMFGRYSRFLKQSNAFWQQFLLEKLKDGGDIKYNCQPFTAQSDLTLPGVILYQVELRKC